MRKNWIDNLRWLMVLLFLLTGISARYSLDKRWVSIYTSSGYGCFINC